jgi:hypothetical protein
MSAGLRALLEGVIDYAGLFPPTQLPLEPALRNYLKYRQEPERWMLGRFIIQAARLPELGALLKGLPGEAPLPLSVLGRGGPTMAEFSNGLVDDLKAMKDFHSNCPGRALIDGFEVRVAPLVLPELENLAQPRNLLSILIVAGKSGVFLEVGMEGDWRRNLDRLIKRIDRVRTEDARSSQVGVKLRCGGLEPAAFPSPEQVAAVIIAARDALVPLKFTAGLHHPIRHYHESVKTEMHGFLNVYVAGVLAHRCHLAEDQVRQILEDDNPAHFRFGDDGLAWQDYRASVGEIKLARQLAVTSFGSCSFDEPRDDLRELGLLR